MSKNVIKGKLSNSVRLINPYEVALNEGFVGSFNDWIHSISSYLCDIFDFKINPQNGHLMGTYDVDKYLFKVDERGHLIVTLK